MNRKIKWTAYILNRNLSVTFDQFNWFLLIKIISEPKLLNGSIFLVWTKLNSQEMLLSTCIQLNMYFLKIFSYACYVVMCNTDQMLNKTKNILVNFLS